VSATVYEIKTALPIDLLWGIIGFIIFTIFFSFIILVLKKPASRLDLLISLLLFMIALLLRILSAKNLSLHHDESIFWQGSFDFLINDWKWSREYMLNGYPPIFYYILAGLTYFFEFNLIGIRTISFISGSLTVVVLYFLAKSLFNRKVGLASALLLCFSSYHIYYSGIAVTDSLVILLMLLSTYFFWIGFQRRVLKFFVLSGLFFGLALDVKYVVIVMVPAVILYIIWIRKSFRFLLEKGVLLWAVSSLVTIAPIQITLILNNINIWALYLKQTFGSPLIPGQKFYPIIELIPRGFRMFIYSMARTAYPWLPWLSIFEIAICVSLIITVAFHAYATLKNRSSESFLLIFMVAMISLLLDPIKHNKWFLYSFPFFFTMLSNITYRYIHDIITKTSRILGTDIFDLHKIITILFGIIFAFSSVFVGITTPFIDKGEYAAIQSSILFIKNRAQPYDIIAAFEVRTLFYYIDLYKIDTVPISLKIIELQQTNEEIISARIEVNEYLLTTLKPRFIIENRAYFNYFYNVTTRQWILQNYDLVFFSRPSLGYQWVGTDFYETLVFERKG
ncbi:MAG: ArnT family glycosyltransferase, partial [Candidatus Hodarchaeota archaeon]